MKNGQQPLEQLYGDLQEENASLEQHIAEQTRKLSQLQAQLRKRNDEVAALNVIAAGISRSASLNELLDWVLGQTVEVFEPAVRGAIFVVADSGRSVLLIAHRGLAIEPAEGQVKLTIGDGNGLCWQVVTTGEPKWSHQDMRDPVSSFLGLNGLARQLFVPLKTQDVIHGLMTLDMPLSYEPSATDIKLLMAISFQIGLAIERSHLFSHFATLNQTLEDQVIERTLELQREKSRLDTILRNVPDGIVFADTDGTLLYVNPSFEQITGYSTQEAVGQHISMLSSEQTPVEVYQKLWQEVQSGNVWQGDLLNCHKEGQLYDAHLVLAPIKNGRGVVNVVGSIRDITQLKELDRMKSRFVATVSHELRTPVSIIKLHSDNMLRFSDQLTDEERNDFLNDIKTQVDALAQLLDDILNLSHLDNGALELQPVTIEFVQLLEEIKIQLDPLAKESQVNLHIIGSESQVRMKAQRDKIKSVLRNLISNAIKFTPAGGGVMCDLHKDDHQMTVRICDTGMGIAQEDLPHIFERFYRGAYAESEQIPGSGLGLAIVKEIVESHNGTIEVESELGKGTTFTVRLPFE